MCVTAVFAAFVSLSRRACVQEYQEHLGHRGLVAKKLPLRGGDTDALEFGAFELLWERIHVGVGEAFNGERALRMKLHKTWQYCQSAIVTAGPEACRMHHAVSPEPSSILPRGPDTEPDLATHLWEGTVWRPGQTASLPCIMGTV